MTEQNPAQTLPARQNQNGDIPSVPQARVNPAIGSRGISITSFDELWRVANAICKSGMSPKGINTPEAIAVTIQFGMELGLGPLAALQSIATINGRPSIYGDSALALVRNCGMCDYYLEFPSNEAVHNLVEEMAIELESNDKEGVKRVRKLIQKASIGIKRDGDDFGYSSISRRTGADTSTVRRFTIGDAKVARLWRKDGPWTNYPERMLMWRSRGFNLRDNFGDVLKGMRTAEEAMDVPDEPRHVDSTVVTSDQESRVATLRDRVCVPKKEPVSEGQRIEPTPEAMEEAVGDAAERDRPQSGPTPEHIKRGPTCREYAFGMGVDQSKAMGIPWTDQLLSEFIAERDAQKAKAEADAAARASSPDAAPVASDASQAGEPAPEPILIEEPRDLTSHGKFMEWMMDAMAGMNANEAEANAWVTKRLGAAATNPKLAEKASPVARMDVCREFVAQFKGIMVKPQAKAAALEAP